MRINATSSENNKVRKDMNNTEELGCPIYDDKLNVKVGKEESQIFFKLLDR